MNTTINAPNQLNAKAEAALVSKLNQSRMIPRGITMMIKYYYYFYF